MLNERGDSVQLALNTLDVKRITFARELRGFTKKELANRIDKTPSAISQIESGTIRPDSETLLRMAVALKLPVIFFASKDNNPLPINLEACHFRSKKKVPQSKRLQSVRVGDLLIELINHLEDKGIVFPPDKISDFNFTPQKINEIETAAVDLRRHWGLGLGPIPNIVKLVESKGIFVLPVTSMCIDIDAYSRYEQGRPYIMLALQKSASRIRFDVAHELAHIVMHEDITTGCATTEKQANRFAGAFLAPRASFIHECPRQWNFQAFERLKFRWKMSIAALIRRAYDLGCLSEFAYRTANIHLRDNGMHLCEGTEWEIEKPTIFQQAFSLLKDNFSLQELSEQMQIYTSELKNMLNDIVTQELIESLSQQKTIEESVPANIVWLKSNSN
jgi:Zn-dependent peptidase ImmA (M78 family)/DNA-binding XRE family transcriptional regulator